LEMRLGKTLLAIRWAETRPAVRTVLAVCPRSVIASWRRELEAEGIAPVELTGNATERLRAATAGVESGTRWFVTNYEGLTVRGRRTVTGRPLATPSSIAKLPWDCVILDESTRIRNPTAQVTKICLRHLTRAKYRVCMSGLPDPEGPQDFVTQMLFMFDRFMGAETYWQWRSRWMQPTAFGWEPKEGTREAVHKEVQRRSYVLTRRDAGLANRKLRDRDVIAVPARVQKEHDSALEDFEAAGYETKSALVKLLWASQIAGGCFDDPSVQHDAKIRRLTSRLLNDLRDEQVVVWYRFNDELIRTARYFDKKRISYGMVYGGQTPYDNDVELCRFQESRDRVILCQTRSIQYGVDLSAASVQVYFSNYLDCEIRAQSEDRLEHPEKQEPILVIDIIAENTIDEHIVELLREKMLGARAFQRRLIKRIGNKQNA